MTAPGSKCLFHVPDPTAPSAFGREQNWLAVERWAETVLPGCWCHNCVQSYPWLEECRLHIPHPRTDDPDEEEQNWLELERWVARLGGCFCSDTVEEPPVPM